MESMQSVGRDAELARAATEVLSFTRAWCLGVIVLVAVLLAVRWFQVNRARARETAREERQGIARTVRRYDARQQKTA